MVQSLNQSGTTRKFIKQELKVRKFDFLHKCYNRNKSKFLAMHPELETIFIKGE